MPATRLKIFISSVQKEFAHQRSDLKAFLLGDAVLRRFVSEVFLFEEIPAKDRRADQLYLEEVERCDIYLGLFGYEYGYEDSEGASATEREFDHATRLGKTRLIYVWGSEEKNRASKMKKLVNKASGDLIRRRIDDMSALTSEGLIERIAEESINVDSGSGGLVFTTDNSRVVVLGKRSSALSQYSAFIVPEKELAKRAIREFSQLASGLLQGIVLRGIANLRENNGRILMRFHAGLDAAFLAHRALLLPDEAFGQIIPLLTDEFHAVLEDKLGDSPLGADSAIEQIIDDWCTIKWKPGSKAKSYVVDRDDGSNFAKAVFCKGPDIKKDSSGKEAGKIHSLLNSIKDTGGHYMWGNKSKSLELTVKVTRFPDSQPVFGFDV